MQPCNGSSYIARTGPMSQDYRPFTAVIKTAESGLKAKYNLAESPTKPAASPTKSPKSKANKDRFGSIFGGSIYAHEAASTSPKWPARCKSARCRNAGSRAACRPRPLKSTTRMAQLRPSSALRAAPSLPSLQALAARNTTVQLPAVAGANPGVGVGSARAVNAPTSFAPRTASSSRRTTSTVVVSTSLI